MKKVSVIIDGFNLYHAIKGLNKPHLKWVNVRALAGCFINHTDEEIARVLFFTASPIHTPLAVQERYKAYTEALRQVGVQVIEGQFKKKFLSVEHEGKKISKQTHEEKETDVNIALAIVEDAFERTSDKLIVITNDSDISPAIRMARRKNPKLKINVVTPPFDVKRANYDLMQACGSTNRNKQGQVYFQTRFIKEIHLERSLLPESMTTESGDVVTIPSQYKRP
ncbi:MAG: NYN domain-containing protein [Rickettsiales bacterium]